MHVWGVLLRGADYSCFQRKSPSLLQLSITGLSNISSCTGGNFDLYHVVALWMINDQNPSAFP